MATIDRERSVLVMIDLQAKLVPAMADSDTMVRNSRRLLDAANLLDVPVIKTEQNPLRLGGTVPDLETRHPALSKMSFSATDAEGFDAARDGRTDVVVSGCEAHVCVLQSAVALKDAGSRVFVVEDAVSSRTPDSKAAAIRRLLQAGVAVVTTEMVVFEWLGTAAHPRFREVVALIK